MAVNLLSRHKNDAKQALRQLRIRPLGNVLTVAVIAFALTLPSCLFVLVKNVMQVHAQLPHSSQISVYMQGEPTAAERERLLKAWTTWEEVSGVSYISPEQGIVEFSEYQGFAQALPLLDGNPLPGVFVVQPVSDVLDEVLLLAQRFAAENRVADVRLDSDWIERFSAIQQLLVVLAMVFSGLMLLVVFLVIGNSLRLQVANEKARIQIMKLVGATDRDILRPYLYTGVWYGVVGATMAWLLAFGTVLLVEKSVNALAMVYGATFSLHGLGLEESMWLLISAALLGVIAAQLSARRHLREIEPV
ncbi:permease-like cell division protein FtsX [Thaumasiovibrio sp. DFM-14]|uniref:permease-like cell division protein FtsX n=1 Tax=Thaumasiovibrio sp. DFM-14 TaxID=3384792 RepID=UPI0039A3A29C